jgi:tRNA1(Val) A37 N6-methylase TrmN6
VTREHLPAVSYDGLLGKKLGYYQPVRGYRVGLEAPLLAAFASFREGRPPNAIADLGAGPGAIGLCLAQHYQRASVTLVEKDACHAALAEQNALVNQLHDRCQVIHAGVEHASAFLQKGSFDLLVSNPPWFGTEVMDSDVSTASGREKQARLAAENDPRRFQSRAIEPSTMRAFAELGKYLLARKGRYCLAIPASSMTQWWNELQRVGLEPKRLRLLYPRAEQAAHVCFVEAKPGKPGGLVVESPWFVRGEGSDYTPTMAALLVGDQWGNTY